MQSVYQRSSLLAQLQASYAEPETLAGMVAGEQMPAPLADWLARLKLLHGVPFNYLVPDEAMLPPESIRFFYVDGNWLAALEDGAMSIGRTLSSMQDTPDMQLHSALLNGINDQLDSSARQIRPGAFGMQPAESPLTASPGDVVSGFLIRSALVHEYPGLGVDVYPDGGTPQDSNPRMLTILRLEQLGTNSDTLLCLIAGDAYRVDIHQAPQGLHYGIDRFETQNANGETTVRAQKNLYTFGNTSSTKDGVTSHAVTMSDTVTTADISSCFRSISPRVLSMDELAKNILKINKRQAPPKGSSAPASIDSAEMGFEMTQGVGMVSFFKSPQKKS